MNVFVDTSAFYAILSKADINFKKAAEDWNRVFNNQSVRLYTSNYVILETCALVRNRLGDEAMRDFLNNLLPVAVVLWIDKEIHKSAIEAMISFGKNGPSLVDCSSFSLMREMGISNALAYDKHFKLQGFSV